MRLHQVFPPKDNYNSQLNNHLQKKYGKSAVGGVA